jgi:hypothetical protein
MLDLPSFSVLVGGLEQWGDPIKDNFQPVVEDRLLSKVRAALHRPDALMYSPPIDLEVENATPRGITVWQFPEWFVVQYEESTGDIRSRRLVHRSKLQKGRYINPDKKKLPVVPIRFVRACIRGHISDIDWYRFVHEDRDCRRQLWLDEQGTSGDLADVWARCECGRSRSLVQMIKSDDNSVPLGFCDGARPWLGVYSRETCGGGDEKPQPYRLLVRSASNAYFPQVVSVIHIPEGDVALRKAVDEVWADYLVSVDEKAELEVHRKTAKVAAALEGLTDDEVFAEIERRKGGAPEAEKSIKEVELETLLRTKASLSDDVPEADFFATALPMTSRSALMKKIDRVVLVHRLREVTAQIGFTRFEPAVTDIHGDPAELELGVRPAALSKEAAWVPAVENRGEGFFLSLSEDALAAWVDRDRVRARRDALSSGFEIWKSHKKQKLTFPGPRYVMLHSLSHLLIQAVSLACGYAASSIRERIYVTGAGCGILLYTGTPDSEGTLGGLVEVGRNVEEHLRAALELGMLCANDPVCAQHRPNSKPEERFLHGAACHGCLLIAETSCEKRNDFLDRALVVPTVDDLGAELFTEDDL